MGFKSANVGKERNVKQGKLDRKQLEPVKREKAASEALNPFKRMWCPDTVLKGSNWSEQHGGQT